MVAKKNEFFLLTIIEAYFISDIKAVMRWELAHLPELGQCIKIIIYLAPYLISLSAV